MGNKLSDNERRDMMLAVLEKYGDCIDKLDMLGYSNEADILDEFRRGMVIRMHILFPDMSIAYVQNT